MTARNLDVVDGSTPCAGCVFAKNVVIDGYEIHEDCLLTPVTWAHARRDMGHADAPTWCRLREGPYTVALVKK